MTTHRVQAECAGPHPHRPRSRGAPPAWPPARPPGRRLPGRRAKLAGTPAGRPLGLASPTSPPPFSASVTGKDRAPCTITGTPAARGGRYAHPLLSGGGVLHDRGGGDLLIFSDSGRPSAQQHAQRDEPGGHGDGAAGGEPHSRPEVLAHPSGD